MQVIMQGEVIWECDIPLTKGFLESIQKFKKLEEEVALEDILKFLSTMPPLKYPLEAELEKKTSRDNRNFNLYIS